MPRALGLFAVRQPCAVRRGAVRLWAHVALDERVLLVSAVEAGAFVAELDPLGTSPMMDPGWREPPGWRTSSRFAHDPDILRVCRR